MKCVIFMDLGGGLCCWLLGGSAKPHRIGNSKLIQKSNQCDTILCTRFCEGFISLIIRYRSQFLQRWIGGWVGGWGITRWNAIKNFTVWWMLFVYQTSARRSEALLDLLINKKTNFSSSSLELIMRSESIPILQQLILSIIICPSFCSFPCCFKCSHFACSTKSTQVEGT